MNISASGVEAMYTPLDVRRSAWDGVTPLPWDSRMSGPRSDDECRISGIFDCPTLANRVSKPTS